MNPIRVQALNLFANAKTQQELHDGMDQLISILLKVGDNELDEHVARFAAAAGLLVANTDSAINQDEIDRIIETLASMKIFPGEFLDEIAKGDVIKTFNESVESILSINPGMREELLNYMINIVLSDKIISKAEIDMLYQFGSSVGLSDMEVATAIAVAIQSNYIPSLESIC